MDEEVAYVRLARWMAGGIVSGLLPFFLAYGVRSYYLGHAPALQDLLGKGDGALVVIGWSVVALLELADSSWSGRWPFALKAVALFLLLLGTLAYGCLTADSVTGRVQTPRQEQMVTALSLAGLVISALVSSVAVAAQPRGEGTS